MAVTLTPAALAHAQRFLHGAGAVGMRFGVKRTGCSGWGYQIDVAREQLAGDSVFEVGGVRVVIDADSLPLVDGTEIDYVRSGLNQQFVFRNPRAVAECGCGESFTTDTRVA